MLHYTQHSLHWYFITCITPCTDTSLHTHASLYITHILYYTLHSYFITHHTHTSLHTGLTTPIFHYTPHSIHRYLTTHFTHYTDTLLHTAPILHYTLRMIYYCTHTSLLTTLVLHYTLHSLTLILHYTPNSIQWYFITHCTPCTDTSLHTTLTTLIIHCTQHSCSIINCFHNTDAPSHCLDASSHKPIYLDENRFYIQLTITALVRTTVNYWY